MVAFVVFGFLVVTYVVFLLWCLAPLISRSRGVLGWLRIAVATILLGANLLPLLAWPIVIPVFAVHAGAGEQLQTATLFLRTVPGVIENVRRRESATATIVDVAYPIEIAGVRYAPVVRTACTLRKTIAVEKGLEIHAFQNYRTASGGEFSAWAEKAMLALDQSNNICRLVNSDRLRPGPFPDYRTARGGHPLTIYVVRGEAEKTQLLRA
jgi:hypothetical protein